MKIEDLFSHIYLLNLDSRTDRLARVSKRLQAQNLSFERFSGIIPTNAGGFHLLGMLGCLLSHLGIIQKAIKEDNGNILIFEDDCVLRDDFREQAEKYLDQLNGIDWDFLFLGAAWHGAKKKEKLSENLYSLDCVYHTHAYAINKKSLASVEKVLVTASQVKRNGINIDMVYSKLPFKKIVVRPNLAVQEPDKSNIEASFTNRLGEYESLDLFEAHCAELTSLKKRIK